MAFAKIGLLLFVASSASALDLKALCPAYPLCDNALIAYYMKLENPQPAAPCANFPLCDVNHVALAQQAGRKRRSLPVPGTTGLVPGSAAEAQWYQQQLAALAPVAPAQYSAATLPVAGTIPGLVPGSAAEAQWYQQQLAAIAAAGRKRRSLPVPGTTGLVPGSAAEAQWYQQQLAALAPVAPTQYSAATLPVSGTIPGLVPGSAAEAQWYQQQLAAIAAAGRKKRSLPVPGTIPGLVPGSAAEAQWYQQQLAALAAAGRKKRSLPIPGTIPGLVSGSAAEAQWFAALQIHRAQIAQHA